MAQLSGLSVPRFSGRPQGAAVLARASRTSGSPLTADAPLRCGELTKWANSGLMHRTKNAEIQHQYLWLALASAANQQAVHATRK
jgi:hypothetical protein